MQMAKLAVTPSVSGCQVWSWRLENALLSKCCLFSMKVQFPNFFCARSPSASILTFPLCGKSNTFVYLYENEFLKVIASVLHSACCSLGEGVINGSSHSVCSRQALLLPLPPWATRTSLTPSQERVNIWLHPASGNKTGKEGDVG